MPPPDGPAETSNPYFGLFAVTKLVTKYLWFFLFVFVTFGITALSNVGFAEIVQRLEEAFHDENSIWRWYAPLAMVGLTLVRGLSYALGTYVSQYISGSIAYRLTLKMYQHLIKLPQTFFDRSSVGELMSKITYNVGNIVSAIDQGIVIILREGLSFLILIIYLFYLNWSLTLIIGLVLPILLLLLRLARNRLQLLSLRLQQNAARISRLMVEALSSLKLVRASAMESKEVDRFKARVSYSRKQKLKVAFVNAITVPSLQFFIAIAFAIIIFVALNREASGFDSVGKFLAYLTAAGFLANPLRNLGNVQRAIQAGEIAARDYIHHLSLEYEEDKGTKVLKKEEMKGAIDFARVSFRYEENRPVFDDLTLKINSHEKVALVGRSGAGKSTLVNLLLRFYLPDEGVIFLDGVNLRDIKLNSLRSSIAYVSQEIFLFNESLRYNLTYGLEGKRSDKQIREILSHAHAEDFVDEMPNGLDTSLGDRGLILSGGQKQRISLARALLKKTPLLILDEATSSLDTESEYRIQRMLESVIKEKTVLVIAHRLSTIKKMDRIIVLDKGKVIEQGSHETLLAKQGAYTALYEHQFRD